ncbi:MAG: hypothetical protein ACP6IP_02175 [Candidatus Njordarchaeia archaeon]
MVKLTSIWRAAKRAILLFLIADAIFLLATHLTFFVEYIVETILIGIPVWLTKNARRKPPNLFGG